MSFEQLIPPAALTLAHQRGTLRLEQVGVSEDVSDVQIAGYDGLQDRHHAALVAMADVTEQYRNAIMPPEMPLKERKKLSEDPRVTVTSWHLGSVTLEDGNAIEVAHEVHTNLEHGRVQVTVPRSTEPSIVMYSHVIHSPSHGADARTATNLRGELSGSVIFQADAIKTTIGGSELVVTPFDALKAAVLNEIGVRTRRDKLAPLVDELMALPQSGASRMRTGSFLGIDTYDGSSDMVKLLSEKVETPEKALELLEGVMHPSDYVHIQEFLGYDLAALQKEAKMYAIEDKISWVMNRLIPLRPEIARAVHDNRAFEFAIDFDKKLMEEQKKIAKLDMLATAFAGMQNIVRCAPLPVIRR